MKKKIPAKKRGKASSKKAGAGKSGRPRKYPPGKELVQVLFRLPPDAVKRLIGWGEKRGMSKPQAVVTIVMRELERELRRQEAAAATPPTRAPTQP